MHQHCDALGANYGLSAIKPAEDKEPCEPLFNICRSNPPVETARLDAAAGEGALPLRLLSSGRRPGDSKFGRPKRSSLALEDRQLTPVAARVDSPLEGDLGGRGGRPYMVARSEGISRMAGTLHPRAGGFLGDDGDKTFEMSLDTSKLTFRGSSGLAASSSSLSISVAEFRSFTALIRSPGFTAKLQCCSSTPRSAWRSSALFHWATGVLCLGCTSMSSITSLVRELSRFTSNPSLAKGSAWMTAGLALSN